MAKVGANKIQENIVKTPVNFLIIDDEPHLDEIGVDSFIKKSNKLFIITTNKNHPVFLRKDADNLEIIYYKKGDDGKILVDNLLIYK